MLNYHELFLSFTPQLVFNTLLCCTRGKRRINMHTGPKYYRKRETSLDFSFASFGPATPNLTHRVVFLRRERIFATLHARLKLAVWRVVEVLNKAYFLFLVGNLSNIFVIYEWNLYVIYLNFLVKLEYWFKSKYVKRMTFIFLHYSTSKSNLKFFYKKNFFCLKNLTETNTSNNFFNQNKFI